LTNVAVIDSAAEAGAGKRMPSRKYEQAKRIRTVLVSFYFKSEKLEPLYGPFTNAEW
jgi:hypothetical protein